MGKDIKNLNSLNLAKKKKKKNTYIYINSATEGQCYDLS